MGTDTICNDDTIRSYICLSWSSEDWTLRSTKFTGFLVENERYGSRIIKVIRESHPVYHRSLPSWRSGLLSRLSTPAQVPVIYLEDSVNIRYCSLSRSIHDLAFRVGHVTFTSLALLPVTTYISWIIFAKDWAQVRTPCPENIFIRFENIRLILNLLFYRHKSRGIQRDGIFHFKCLPDTA